MNEITEVRRLRDDAPLPPEERLSSQRARLLEAMNTGAVRRDGLLRAGAVVRRRGVLIPAVAVAAAVTVGVLAQLPGAPGEDAAPKGGARGGVLSAEDSAAALNLAAATVEKSTVTEPGPKQWVYEKSVDPTGSHKITYNVGDHKVSYDPSTSESWTRWDGTGFAHRPGFPRAGRIPKSFDPNKLQVWYGPDQEEKWKKEGYDDRSQRQFWRFLVTLPSDPDAMMKKIREEHAIGDVKNETQAQRDWREISVLFRSVLIPSHVQAGMYRVLAKIPGARVEKGVKDPLGRDAIGVFVNYPEKIPSGWQGRQEFFLDPTTYAYLGQSRQDGEMVGVRAAWGVVDRPGQRP